MEITSTILIANCILPGITHELVFKKNTSSSSEQQAATKESQQQQELDRVLYSIMSQFINKLLLRTCTNYSKYNSFIQFDEHSTIRAHYKDYSNGEHTVPIELPLAPCNEFLFRNSGRVIDWIEGIVTCPLSHHYTVSNSSTNDESKEGNEIQEEQATREDEREVNIEKNQMNEDQFNKNVEKFVSMVFDCFGTKSLLELDESIMQHKEFVNLSLQEFKQNAKRKGENDMVNKKELYEDLIAADFKILQQEQQSQSSTIKFLKLVTLLFPFELTT